MNRVVLILPVTFFVPFGGCKEEGASGGGAGSGGAKPATRAMSPELANELSERLEAAYREDKVAAGTTAAGDVAAAGTGAPPKLVGLAARAFLRAGDLPHASELVNAAGAANTEVPLLLTRARLARGTGALAMADTSLDAALKAAPDDPELLNELVFVRQAQQRYADAAAAAERLDKALAAASGYPTELLRVMNAGRAEFLAQVKDQPLNVVAQLGTQKMVWAPTDNFQQPYIVEAKINGQGPFTLAIDLIGGHSLHLRPTVAEAAGVLPIADGEVITMAGPRPARWAIVNGLELGTAKLERVITRIFDEPAKPDYVFDGALGVGLFRSVRMRMNMLDQRFELEASGPFETGNSDHGTELLVYLADDRPVFTAQFEGAPRLTTLGAYVHVATITEPVMLERFKESDTTILPMLAPGIPAEHPVAPLGDREAYTPEQLTWHHPSRFGNDAVTSYFCGREVPLSLAVAMPFHDATIERLIGARPGLMISTDKFQTMHVVSFDGPTHTLQIQWIPIPPAPATAPAAAGTQPAEGSVRIVPGTQPSE